MGCQGRHKKAFTPPPPTPPAHTLPFFFFFDKVSIIENMKTLDYDKYVTYYNAFYLT